MKVFEVSDVAYKALELERKTRNERHFAAAWYGKTSGFEVVHGLLDRVMAMLDVAFAGSEKVKKDAKANQYWIEELDGMLTPHFFTVRAICNHFTNATLARPYFLPRPLCFHPRHAGG